MERAFGEPVPEPAIQDSLSSRCHTRSQVGDHLGGGDDLPEPLCESKQGCVVGGFVQRGAGVFHDHAVEPAVDRVSSRRFNAHVSSHARHDERLHLQIAEDPVDIGGIERAVGGFVDYEIAGPRGDLIEDSVAGRPQRVRNAETQRLLFEAIASAEVRGKVAPIRQHGAQRQVNDSQVIGPEDLEKSLDVWNNGLAHAGEVVACAGGIHGGKNLPKSIVGMRIHVLHVNDHERAFRSNHREVRDRQPPGHELVSPPSHVAELLLVAGHPVLVRTHERCSSHQRLTDSRYESHYAEDPI